MLLNDRAPLFNHFFQLSSVYVGRMEQSDYLRTMSEDGFDFISIHGMRDCIVNEVTTAGNSL